MKTSLLALLLSPLLSFSQARTASELQNEGFKKYADQSGQIIYEIKGDASGDETMIFDTNGWRSMRKQTMVFELYGIKTIQTLHEITDGDFVYRPGSWW
ncbi:MAG: hypothetical protein AAF391_06010 [Bacteroidota bacterium]